MFDEEHDIETPIPEVNEPSPSPSRDDDQAVVGELEWDEEDSDTTPGPSEVDPLYGFLAPRAHTPNLLGSHSPHTHHERTPLLRKTTSLSFLEHRGPRQPLDAYRTVAQPIAKDVLQIAKVRRASQLSVASRTDARRVSTGRAPKYIPSGQSTFGQTVSSL